MLFLTLTVQGKLHAQQMPGNGLPDNGQYAPEQQSGNNNNSNGDVEQPGYQAPQSDGQQAYPQQPSQVPGPTDTEPGNGQAPLSPPDLEQLVAPIALYPDALVAQVLTASTYPQQVADADHWRRVQGYAPAEEIVAGADAHTWDPSVKALTAFPQVLDQMDQNLNWTTELGNAYYNQPQDVLRAVQVMRQRAQAAGNLRSTPQESVSYDQGNIVLAPVNPQLVYVPAYNPWAVYGQPVAPYPGFSVLGAIGSFLGSAFAPSAVRFGLGIAMTAFTHTPWGWLGWGLNWLAQAVLFNHSNYYSHSTTVADWGLPHGGPRAFARQGAFAGNRSYRPFGDPGAGYGGMRSQGFDRARNENAFAANRPGERYSRSYQTSRNGYGPSSHGPSRDAYRGIQPAIARSQQNRSQFGSRSFGNSGYASNSYGRSSYDRSSGSFGSRVNPTYGGSTRGNRTPGAGFQGSDFGKHSSGGFRGKGFSGSSGKQHSGGFHFGGGHAPKSSGGGKGFGHGHSGEGHSGGHGHSGGKHHH